MNRPPRWPVVTGAVVGVALMAVGVSSLLQESHDTHPFVTARWVVGLALAHDLVLAPLVVLVGAALRRWVPLGARAFLAGGLVVSGALTLIAWPLVRGYGRSAGNPSILPRDYGRGLLVALVATWVVTALLALRARTRTSGGTP